MRIESIEEVRVFLQVVESGSLTKAATVLGMTKNLVSRRLAALEERLGVRLLERSTRRIGLTPRGMRFRERALALLDTVEAAERDLVSEPDTLSGLIRVAVPTLLAEYGLIERLGALLRSHSEFAVQLLVTDERLELVANAIDLALSADTQLNATYRVQRIGVLTPVLACAPAYARERGCPKRPEELRRHECLRFLSPARQRYWTLVDKSGRELVTEISGRFECNDSRVLVAALHGGLGIGLRPRGELRAASGREKLVHVLPDYHLPPLVLRAATPSRRHDRRRLDKLVELFQEVLRSAE